MCCDQRSQYTQILADQLTLFQPGGTDFAHLITSGTPGFLDLPTALKSRDVQLVLQGLLKEQVLFLYLVKSGTPSCTGSNPDYNKKHENMDA